MTYIYRTIGEYKDYLKIEEVIRFFIATSYAYIFLQKGRKID